MEYVISLILVVLSALFSGLTLGLLSLDAQSLRRRAKHGDKDAARVYGVRKNGNQLLVTLILGNVVVNTTLSIFLGSIASGLVAGILATALIVIFGEIIPQAVITRHALWYGARTLPFTRLVLFLFYPVAYPIAQVLNRFLGSELPTLYSKSELMDIVSEHEESDHSPVDADEKRIVHGALQFSHQKVREVMTAAENVVSVDENQKLNDEFFNLLNDQGFSRLPVYSGEKSNIIGMLYVKDLLIEDDDISIRQTEEAFDTNFMTVRPDELLDVVLAKMLKRRQHLAIVQSRNEQFLGVISLEDIIEQIIQHEIEDEDDEETE
jgi:metal transporter CNNM